MATTSENFEVSKRDTTQESMAWNKELGLKTNDVENLTNETIAENLPNQKNKWTSKHKGLGTLVKHSYIRVSPWNVVVKIIKLQNKEITLNNAREKCQLIKTNALN